jgi:DNA-directed RNA polymerase specialized sigma24 family protein
MAKGVKNRDLQLDIFAHFLAGEKTSDIAAAFEMTKSGVSNHISRAWSRLRGQLVAQEIAVD